MSDSRQTSRAAVLTGVGQIEMRNFPLPEIGTDDGLLRLEATGVCGSDVHAYMHGYDVYEPPCILGHELVGRIVEIGPRLAERAGVEQGQRVVVEEYLPCGLCEACLDGVSQMCRVRRYGARRTDSAPGLWGGYSEYMYLDSRSLIHPVSEQLDPTLVQLYVPISNGLHWAQGVGGAKVGSSVLVIGPGPHGLGSVIGAREAGAGLVALVGTANDGKRLAVGRELGADETIVSGEEDVRAVVERLTSGRGADVIVNAAAGAAAVNTAIDAAAERATIVQAGIGGGAGAVDVDAIAQKHLTVKGVLGRPSSLVPVALRLIESGRYPLEQMCTHYFDLESVEEALRAPSERPDVIRSIVVPGGMENQRSSADGSNE